MQKRIFQGLKMYVVCVGKRFHRIEHVTPLVNKCKDFIYEQLTKLVENSELVKKIVMKSSK